MNNVGTMIGINGGPMPESPVTGNTTLNIGGPNGQLTKVKNGAVGGEWYDKKESIKPRAYHKYFKGCKYRDKDDEPEDPDTEDNTGSNTGQDPTNPPEESEDGVLPVEGEVIIDSEE